MDKKPECTQVALEFMVGTLKLNDAYSILESSLGETDTQNYRYHQYIEYSNILESSHLQEPPSPHQHNVSNYV